MKKTYQMTLAGKKALEEEVAELKGRRGEIADKIAEARDFGDLKENAEYSAARDEQGVVESRIAEIEMILGSVEIIESGTASQVSLGSKVTLKNDQKEVTYTVVGPVEANPLEGKVSNESPIGQALMGKKLNDNVTIVTPKVSTEYTISQIG